MRYAARITTFAVLALAGCRSSSTPLTNPFLTPDRVPPPSTQLLTPGTAQPYYPGDSIPATAPLAAPAQTFVPAPGAVPNAAPPVNAYPGTPVTPTIQPGAGGVYPPQASGDAVGIPADDQAMRFASATLTPEPSTASATTAAPLNPAASTFRTPIQSMLPVAQPLTSAFPVNAGGQSSVRQATFGAAQTPQVREVTQAEYMAPAAAVGGTIASSTASAASDGFRAQSNEPRTESTIAAPVTNGFRPPSIGKQTAGGDNPTGKFGVGGKQEWLRGQLEYWPEAGEWSIRYMDDGPADQLGGRVLIDNPQVLGNLPAGEFVMVEGQLYGRQIDESSYRPAYRVSVVQRQRQ